MKSPALKQKILNGGLDEWFVRLFMAKSRFWTSGSDTVKRWIIFPKFLEQTGM